MQTIDRCALAYWLWEETYVLKGVGSNPSPIYCMDVFHIYLLQN